VSPGVIGRAWQVARVFAHALVVPWLLRRRTASGPQRVQAALEELGGAWIKLGQALALRFDVLPADYCLQLFQLLNQVRPFPADEVRRVVERELGRPVEALFARFDWSPIAAASIGQVHRAELPDGTAVAVKVQRPGVRELISADLRLMRGVAALLDVASPFGRTRARELVREFARWTGEELDYRMEARHVSVLRRNAEDDPFERNPRVFPAYTTERVLTLEYLDGVPVVDIVAAIRRHDAAFLEALAARGHDRRRIARHVAWNALNQVYRFGYFHADPHPANLIVLKGDAIGYVDFGIVGKLDEQTTGALRYFAQSLFAGRVSRAVEVFLRFLAPSRRTDLAAAHRDLVEAMKTYLESARVSPREEAAPEEIFEIAILRLARRHGMALAPDAARYLKAVLTAEATVKELDPSFDLTAHENRFFGRLLGVELAESLGVHGVGQWLLDARVRLERVLDAVESLGDAPGRLAPLAGEVRRRVQVLSVLTLAGWVALLVAAWNAGAAEGLRVFGYRFGTVALLGGLASAGLLVFAILQVRRLPSDVETAAVRYPRRLR
jgi:predicted unusual protein kinase regulating ubiquinone biosynthesis (AarF/ABC1/UbiB family)